MDIRRPGPRVCAVIAAQNEAARLPHVLRQLHRALVDTCIIVANGCSDDTAAVAAGLAPRLFSAAEVAEFAEPLGHDVPRAAGAYAALRRFRPDWLVFVDADWQGNFGPALGRFIAEAAALDADVLWAGCSEVRGAHAQLWRRVLTACQPRLAAAAPWQLPVVVHRRVFARISPACLHHPGLWFAETTRHANARLNLHVRQFDIRIAGNPVRNAAHQRKLAETLLGDALEGCRLLLGRRPHRGWHGRTYLGYHPQRRTDLLRMWQSRDALQL